MQIQVHTHDMGLSPRLQEYIDKKLERLDRYLSNIRDANLELRKEGRSNQPIVQLTIRNDRGTIFRVEEKRQDDFFAAIDVVVDRMQRQLSKHKTRQRRKGNDRWVEAQAEELDLLLSEEEEETNPIVRRKKIVLNPMYEEEAVEQIELLGHDFFVYMDGDSGSINVLYKRQDGDYGLLETSG
jgi:putative sigma-54 modulation protein